MDSKTTSTPVLGRPRSAKARQAVLTSTLTLLKNQPASEVTIKAIAADAGVGRQTIYRWWSNRGQIILEALNNVSQQRIGREESGTIDENIRRFIAVIIDQARQLRKALSVVMVEAQLEPEFQDEFRTQFIAVRRAALLGQFESKTKKGNRLPPVEMTFLADMVFGPLWYRLLVDHAPLDRKFATLLSEAVLERFHALK